MRRIKMLVCLIFLFASIANSQTNNLKWYNPMEVGMDVIQNRAWGNEIGNKYQRLPQRAEHIVGKDVWNLSKRTAGLSIHFNTNASDIYVKYIVTGAKSMPHMSSTGVSGVDLYAIDSDGKSRWTTGNYSFGDTVTYRFNDLIPSSYHSNGFEYRLFLPLYNSVEWLEIGVPEGSEFAFIEHLPTKPIVVYGTSIAQGACASRSGMGWTNLLSRQLDYPVVNLGFSGKGPLDSKMVDLISEIDASLYVYDCLPNMGNLSDEEIFNRTVYGISKIRENSDVPILVVDHIGSSKDEMNVEASDNVARINKASRNAFDSLKNIGVKEIYYLAKESIAMPKDGYVDYVHPNDLGMSIIVSAYEKTIRKILNMEVGDINTTIPVSQRREPYLYEWTKRHNKILKEINNEAPKRVILGNSIVHYWGGSSENQAGKETWEKVVKPLGYANMGFGWDRVENVLWRVYHGALDGFEAEEVILMIGTNNVGSSTDEEIVKGLEFLLEQIRLRQPHARIKIAGLLPRRNTESKIETLNERISDMAESKNYVYINPGRNLLLENGLIDESLFSDGLHPNEKGYWRIAKFIVE